MARYVELIDKYQVVQSEDSNYNPPSYVWVDNTGKIVRCRDCVHWLRHDANKTIASCDRDALLRHEGFFCADGERRTEHD